MPLKGHAYLPAKTIQALTYPSSVYDRQPSLAAYPLTLKPFAAYVQARFYCHFMDYSTSLRSVCQGN